MARRLKGKRAVVTGAGQGIGRQTVLAFAEEGAHVWATSRTFGKMADFEKNPDIDVFELDVTELKNVQKISGMIGPADVLVNCAGIVPSGSIQSCSPKEFQRTFDVNVGGAFFMMQAFIDGMCAQSRGSIINVASVLSSISSVPDRFAYTMSKAALIGMTKSVAADYASRGVRCNAVCPGAIDSRGFQERMAATSDPEKIKRFMVDRHPLGRLGTTEEIAKACVYLASDESAFMTGQLLVIDGGMTI